MTNLKNRMLFISSEIKKPLLVLASNKDKVKAKKRKEDRKNKTIFIGSTRGVEEIFIVNFLSGWVKRTMMVMAIKKMQLKINAGKKFRR